VNRLISPMSPSTTVGDGLGRVVSGPGRRALIAKVRHGCGLSAVFSWLGLSLSGATCACAVRLTASVYTSWLGQLVRARYEFGGRGLQRRPRLAGGGDVGSTAPVVAQLRPASLVVLILALGSWTRGAVARKGEATGTGPALERAPTDASALRSCGGSPCRW
jgi:hypothetical protein